jgi:hypothetical protein
MARTPITAVQVTKAGVASMVAVAADVANGNSMVNNARLKVGVTNTDGAAAHNFSVTPVQPDGGGSVTPISTPIPANTTRPIWFGPYDTAAWGSTLLINGDNAALKFEGYYI